LPSRQLAQTRFRPSDDHFGKYSSAALEVSLTDPVPSAFIT
jgi:hypothetical protein